MTAPNSSCLSCASYKSTALFPLRTSVDDVNQWAQSLDKLLGHKCKYPCAGALLHKNVSKVTQ